MTHAEDLQGAVQNIKIGGNVYGGGNAGDTGGSTSVTVRMGDIDGSVFGGARKADVAGNTFVNIAGEDAPDNSFILINRVYGGNDIAGKIGTFNQTFTLPAALKKAGDNGVGESWNAFVRVSSREGGTNQRVYIGQLFGGGNGAYDYTKEDYTGLEPPTLDNTYLEIVGGSIVYAYGGGDSATINKNTVIYVDNDSHVVNSIEVDKSVNNVAADEQLLTTERLQRMGINTTFSHPTSGEFQIGSFFGGNNKATMAIRPKWNLKNGKIRNLYSGGNEGSMTSPDGLLLEIAEGSTVTVDYVYGGCRKADVKPSYANGDLVSDPGTLTGYNFPSGYAARTLIRGGNIHHVYGGNDISGKVYFGNAIGIHTSISGDVYGGGNGSYPYTDNPRLKGDAIYGDFYYGDFLQEGITNNRFETSVDALNAFRPNADKVSLRVWSNDSEKPTVIGGAIYVGGNSASLTNVTDSKAELKIGSYVIADTVFLGNNGENMIAYNDEVVDPNTNDVTKNEGVLKTYSKWVAEDGTIKDTKTAESDTKFNSMTLVGTGNVFDKYMDGCAMEARPEVVFDNEDLEVTAYTYDEYSTYFGSFFCGGNVGSLKRNGLVSIEFNHAVVIYDKLVGGSNKAYVPASAYNAEYKGGVIGDPDSEGNKLELKLSGLKIEPKRWNSDHTDLIWNTQINGVDCDPITGLGTNETYPITSDPTTDNKRRLVGGNIYGGCCESGVVNGNVIINVNSTIVERDNLFDEVEKDADDGEERLYDDNPLYPDTCHITKRNTGVILSEQGMDVLSSALNIFGGGKGKDTEIWGSTTINLNRGYVFQVFGGSENGVIGKKDANGNLANDDNDKYSCYVNLAGVNPGVSKKTTYNENMPECEFIYGGGFMGPIAGNTVVRLGNGRIFNSFAGSCYADILGHTETYIGYDGGFPWIRDYVYGGNNLGGEIKGSKSFSEVEVSAYVEYLQGRAQGIFGGCYGTYDYVTDYHAYADKKPFLGKAFVNFKPNVTDELKSNANNTVSEIYGAGQGYPGDADADQMQNSSYVLIDIPQDMTNFKNMMVFGAGAWSGLGMKTYVAPDASEETRNGASAIIDLKRGQIATVFGGSYREGVTRRSVVNVPAESTISLGSIFGGAYGTDTFSPCDVYEGNVNWNSSLATLIYDPATNENYLGAIYGGNNNERRTLYGHVTVTQPVAQKKVIQYKDEIKGWEKGQVMTTNATVYGAGRGANTWSEYTQVDLQNGAKVYEVYGGGQKGKVLNAETIQYYIDNHKPTKWPEGTLRAGNDYTDADWQYAWSLDAYATPEGKQYWENPLTNLSNPLVRAAEMDDRDFSHLSAEDKAMIQNRYSTNVIINEGATVNNYAYGGGYGEDAVVSGYTYITLLGGEVKKDIYAGGTSGSVEDLFGAGVYSSTNTAGFVASANVYIKGGTCRNVYGGGWRGSVGHHGPIGQHTGEITLANDTDIDGESHVVIGDLNGTSHTSGIPSITRNVYGGGEGGTVYGDAYVKMNKGYIGYRYNASGTDKAETTDINEKYEPELDDVEAGDNLLDKGGNVFGGGYVANSYVDRSHVTMWGGIVRGSLYGGGEIGPIGRGTVHTDSIAKYTTALMNGAAIFKGGATHVELWDGHVMRDVFGGGRGYDNWGGEGYMTDDEEKTMDRSSKGYVFGSTDVHIYGGEIGTIQNVLKGYGNVFGGGNEGFVYSATGTKNADSYYRDSDSKLSEDCKVSVEPQCKVTNADGITIGETTYAQGTYVPLSAMNKMKSRDYVAAEWEKLDTRGIVIHNALFAGGNITEGSDNLFANTVTVYGNAAASLRDVYNFDLISLGTEEMGGLYGDGNLTLVDGFREVHIDNYGTDYYSLKETMTLDEYKALTTRQQAYYKLKYAAKEGHTYSYYESKQLHTYKYTDSEGSHEVSYRKGQKITAETYTAFGNNKSDPSKEDSPLESSYWQQGSKLYQLGEQIEEGEYSLMDGTDSEIETQKTGEKAKWTLLGVTTIYAGRPMNTIQRADFCGVFGSRMVMKGAVDRAPQVNGGVDYNSYTINRVEEVSLNKRTSSAGDTSDKDKEHGNYFGIYNSVKFLGNLTSDVDFNNARKTDTKTTDAQADGSTYYSWKSDAPQSKYRNNGISHNKVALASGVYLELKKEETETAGKDVWGLITGIIELDLINVMPGMGGGYVYAKNEHGTRSQVESVNKVSLLSYNTNASTYRQFSYSESPEAIETSGNFVHNTKQIVDDCYPNGGMYTDGYVASPAHYWFIRGSIYVYDQYISAYTGAANATAEKQEIPLTISAASNGRMTLRDVQPNLYAYYDKGGNKLGTANADSVFVVNNVSYKLNQPISNWEYSLLSEGDKAKFVDSTFVVIENCKIGETEYKKGLVMLAAEYKSLMNSASAISYMDGDVEKTTNEEVRDSIFKYLFRPSNNLSHNTGYVLTYDVNNPMVWNNYYTKTASPGQANSLNTKQYTDGKDKAGNSITKGDYIEGPTYTLTGESNGVFGQQDYTKGSIIYGKVVTRYNTNISSNLGDNPPTQAQVERAYVVKEDYTLKDDNGEVVQELIAGTPVYQSKYTTKQWNAMTTANAVELAQVCTSLLEFSTTDYVWAGKVLSSADIAELKIKVIEKKKYVDDNKGTAEAKATNFLSSYLDDAYYCTSAGKYGGTYFEHGKAYSAIDTWCSMSETERANFTFNYDALDLLIDPTFGGTYGNKVQYDGDNTDKVYSSAKPIDYTAEFYGYKDKNDDNVTSISFTPKGAAAKTINKSTSPNDWLSREAYEAIPNEKRHYSPITITAPGNYYLVREAFMNGEVPYTTGQQIDQETYDNLGTIKQANIDVINFTAAQAEAPTQNEKGEDVYDAKTYYYCRSSYTVDEKGEGKAVTTIAVTKNSNSQDAATYDINAVVPMGVVIDETTYDDLCNFQKGFVIHGTSPTEISTLYVSNESDIHDLSTEKIITVVYLYEYDESDESGLNVTPVSERHIVNIHINFKSGVPEVGEITKPDIVLPGTTIGLNIPSVTQGAYRVTGSGWEIFSNSDDAVTHYNGMPFVNNETPLYWYQNDYWIAYYAQTVLGKTYSKSVKLSVANYHDLKKVMDDTQHHYYIDHKDVDRQPKIYINDYKESSQNGLDLLKNLMDLTHGKEVAGHQPLTLTHALKPMRNGQYLEFFLKTDLDHSGSAWTPIANETGQCFSGTLHGDGHTISGLDHSFINHLCGHIYNLGVSGSFTTSGIAEEGDGYMENCWVKTTGTPVANTHPLFGNPTATDYSQVVNCYYLEDGETSKYAPFTDGKNMGTKKSTRAFYNGEVAYDLNGFYLNKRYYEGKGDDEPTTPTDAKLTSGSSYVTSRYADGDFIYANGEIPSGLDERALKDNEGKAILDNNGRIQYTPKWPVDYLFFGQTLNYGHVENVAHQEVPSTIDATNRVFRAPAYFGNSTMGVAHFNPNAIFAQTKKNDATVEAYKGMTAIDFTGNSDAAYQQGLNDGKFYAPLLDDGGLTDFTNVDLTSNLLVYTHNGSTTENVVKSKLTDKAYNETNDTYHTVAAVTDGIRGHWVQKVDAGYKAIRDHFLVDKEDFNAPISYTFDTDKRMWYQRMPDNYVGREKADKSGYIDRGAGWEGISLPFTAEIVTTDVKGELTHFYGESSTGHEYWLRKFEGGAMKTGSTDIFEATFNRPANGTETKTYSNTFLWDYYYSKNDRYDLNSDQYPGSYYNAGHDYENYPRLAVATPYIIGFPGKRYYEFDLSGNFVAGTAKVTAPAKLSAQTITFASKTGATIDVSDTELATHASAGGYDFVSNYASKTLTDVAYILNTNDETVDNRGNSYQKVATGAVTVPFRPYFINTPSSGAPKMVRTIGQSVRTIVFSNETTQLQGNDKDMSADDKAYGLDIYAKRKKIIVESNLRETTEVRIVNATGITVSTFTIEPGETIETDITIAGVYIVRADNGRYTKKIALR